MWKVYDIETGKVIKAGFETEDDAKEWLESKVDALTSDYEIEEMDEDEEAEYDFEGEDEDMSLESESDDEEEEEDGDSLDDTDDALDVGFHEDEDSLDDDF